MLCKLFGHNFTPLEYWWGEKHPSYDMMKSSQFISSGYMKISMVYCQRCKKTYKIVIDKRGKIEYVLFTG